MNLPSRSCLVFPAFALLSALPLRASAIDESIPNPQALTQLEQRAGQARPRDQVFLYVQLVHTMTELAARQLDDGKIVQASATLQQVSTYARLIHLDLSTDTRRVKNAEMLMEHTTLRLRQYLHVASSDDQPLLEATLKQLNGIHTELLARVFEH